MVSCQKGPTRHAYAWQIGPFWQDTLDVGLEYLSVNVYLHTGVETVYEYTSGICGFIK